VIGVEVFRRLARGSLWDRKRLRARGRRQFRDVPLSGELSLLGERRNSTLPGQSAFAPGMALPAPNGTRGRG